MLDDDFWAAVDIFRLKPFFVNHRPSFPPPWMREGREDQDDKTCFKRPAFSELVVGLGKFNFSLSLSLSQLLRAFRGLLG